MNLTTAANYNNLSAASILIKLKDDPDVKIFLDREPTSALDIGFQFPMTLWDLYHDVGFKKLVGYETESMQQVVERMREKEWNPTADKYLREHEFIGVFDLYKFYLSIADNSTFEFRPRLNSLEEIEKVCTLNFNESWESTSEVRSQVDYLVLSNIVHLYHGNRIINENTHGFLNKAQSALKRNAFVFIRVPHKDHPNTSKYPHIPFDENNFLELVGNYFTKIYFEVWKNEAGENRSIIYLGKK